MQNAREALRIVRQLGTAEDEVLALSTLLRVCVVSGDLEGALAWVNDVLPLLADYDSEGIAPQVNSFHALALAGLGRHAQAREALARAEQSSERQWPYVQVRTDLAKAGALRRLGESERARKLLQRALASAEANGFRFFQLLIHHELTHVADDETARSRHSRVASALARSLAANLSREDAKLFLSREWGGVRHEA